MRSRGSGHTVVGATCATFGALALVAGLARPPQLSGAFLGTPAWALTLTGGSVLALAGALVLVFSVRRVDEPEPDVRAEVAFSQRMIIPDTLPMPAGVPARARPAGAGASSARLPAPQPSGQQRVAPRSDDLSAIDTQISALTRKINKAGVMLATGQLSQQGYLAYVDDIKRQRGSLEAQRVRVELKG